MVSRGQLLVLGMSDRSMQYRVRPGGPWQVLLPGVYLGVSGTPNLPQKEMAALLYAGPRSLITGPVAMLHHRVRGPHDLDTIDVLFPRRGSAAAPVSSGSTARLGCRTGLSLAAPYASWRRPDRGRTFSPLTHLQDVRAVVAGAVQLGRCTVCQLANELRNGPVRGSAVFRTVLGEVADGIWSTAEGDLRALIRAARLPKPLFNPSLYSAGLSRQARRVVAGGRRRR